MRTPQDNETKPMAKAARARLAKSILTNAPGMVIGITAMGHNMAALDFEAFCHVAALKVIAVKRNYSAIEASMTSKARRRVENLLERLRSAQSELGDTELTEQDHVRMCRFVISRGGELLDLELAR